MTGGVRQCQNGECNGNGFGSLSGEFLNQVDFSLWVSSMYGPESRIISFWLVSQWGLPNSGYHRNNPPGLPLIVLDNRPISHSHREGLQGAVLWLVDQDLVIQGLVPNLVTPTQIIRHFKNTFFCLCFEIRWLFWQVLQVRGCLFFGDRFIGQQVLIGSQTFLYLITWCLFHTWFSKNTWTPKMNLFLIKYLLSWFN